MANHIDDHHTDEKKKKKVKKPRAVELRLFGRTLDRGFLALIGYLIAFLSSTHTLAVAAFALSHSAALGIVFVAVAHYHLGKPVSLADTVVSGARLGLRRLAGLMFMRWAARDMLIMLLWVCFVSEIGDPGKLFKLFVSAKLVPFALVEPFLSVTWFSRPGPEFSGLLYAWMAFDKVSSIVLAVNPFVVVFEGNGRRSWGVVVEEGCYLVSLMISQAAKIKYWETVFCGYATEYLLTKVGGRIFAMAFQSVVEVYFIIVWLVFYFAARSKVGFGRGDLEDFINRLR